MDNPREDRRTAGFCPDWHIRVVEANDCLARLPDWERYHLARGVGALAEHPRWLAVLARSQGHRPYGVEALAGERLLGVLPLALVRSLWFGRFLVGLPYVNTGGVQADSQPVAAALVDAAVGLADRLDVRYLELRHERPLEHPALGATLQSKVHMRLALPSARETLWQQVGGKVRNQIRKGEKQGLTVEWGTGGLLPDFYTVFAHTMRDLGTPVFSRRLFAAILEEMPGLAELAVVRREGRAVAAALLLHGRGTTEVPSAGALRRFRSTNANMFLYWHLLVRAVERGQAVFDFGRSTADSNTYRFKEQWGARPVPAVWQYYLRRGSADAMRPETSGYGRLIRAWQRLPVWLTRLVGPAIVRGIP